MARINVEDSWWTDPRRFQLAERLGSRRLADGLAVEAWHLSQVYWANGRKKVPEFAFKEIPNWEDLVAVDLAIKHGHFFYVRGTRQLHEWIALLKESGSKGGKSKAKHLKQIASKSLANAYPLISSLSSLFSKEENTNTAKHSAPAKAGLVLPLDKIYQEYPRKMGKAAGLKRLAKEIQSENDLSQCLVATQNFVRYHAERKTEEQYLPYFSTFVSTWRDWLDPAYGRLDSKSYVDPRTKELLALLEKEEREKNGKSESSDPGSEYESNLG